MNTQDQQTHETLTRTFLIGLLNHAPGSQVVKEEPFSEFLDAVHREDNAGNIRTLYKKRVSGLSTFIIASVAAHLVMGHTVLIQTNNRQNTDGMVDKLACLIGKAKVTYCLDRRQLKVVTNDPGSIRGYGNPHDPETTYVYVDNADHVCNKGLEALIKNAQVIFKKELRFVLCATAEAGKVVGTEPLFGILHQSYVDRIMKKYMIAN